jgi:hypothetical protein
VRTSSGAQQQRYAAQFLRLSVRLCVIHERMKEQTDELIPRISSLIEYPSSPKRHTLRLPSAVILNLLQPAQKCSLMEVMKPTAPPAPVVNHLVVSLALEGTLSKRTPYAVRDAFISAKDTKRCALQLLSSNGIWIKHVQILNSG